MFASSTLSRTLAGAAGTLLFAGLCVGAATAPAAARMPITYGVDQGGARVAHVHYSDINLASALGRSQLDTRVRIAARQVCRNDGQDARAAAAANRCYQNSLRATRAAAMAAITAEKAVG